MTGTLRIGIVCLHTDPFQPPGSGDVGGMNVVVRQTSAAMAAAGHEVTVWTRLSSADRPEREDVDGVRLRRLPVGPPRTLLKSDHDHLIEPFRVALAADRPQVDVLHSHHWFSGVAALPLARELGVPHLQSFHSIAAPPQAALSEGEPPESQARLEGETWLARRTDAVVAVSEAEARTVVDRLGADPAVVHVVHPGVDPDLFHPEPVPGGRPMLLAAARLEPLKAIDLAIQTLAGVIERRSPDAPRPRLVVAGGATSDEAYPRSLAALAERLGVADDVALVGPQDRRALAALMRASALVLVPSHSETYGLVALEAAASGVPVVAARTGGLAESVVDGVTGVLLPGWNPSTWSEAVAALLADPERAAALGAAGRAHALERRWEDVAEATIALYRGSAGARLSRRRRRCRVVGCRVVGAVHDASAAHGRPRP
ncbi:glycosyltransferase [Pseudactinotalea suaedae]|uniref:glycosyltransferase n=1 Tax=Pseudactinotalea suaedae TaxID=1524924 RepID=UPI0012E13CE9|nr:glycosyltransferase [Pseudactinotalea suaedae]